MSSNQNIGKMYTINHIRIFYRNFAVEKNLTRSKDDFWSYLNRPFEIVVVWDDRTTANMNS